MNVINFSGGRTSAYMTKRLIDDGLTDYIVTFQNTGKESNETLDFIHECDMRWKLNVVWLEYRTKNDFIVVDYESASRNGEPFEMVIQDNNMLPNGFARFCTRLLKQETGERYLKSIGLLKYDKYLGIRYDEPRRWMKRVDIENEFLPLVKWKVGKNDVLEWWKSQDFDLQLNEPFGNCDCCFHKKPSKMKYMAKHFPEKMQWWIDMENKYGNYFRGDGPMKKILDNAHVQLDMFDDDMNDVQCFCNID